MLIIDLRRLDQAPVEVSAVISSDDPFWDGTGVELAAPFEARATAEGSATRGVWVRGAFAGTTRAACRRCLEPLELAISEEFDWLFDPNTSETEADLALYALDPDADELDLSEPLRERFLLAIPAFPSCPDACSGFCGRCGASLEEGDCNCQVEETDPRWVPLQALRRDSPDRGV